jgi:hypothetical protein
MKLGWTPRTPDDGVEDGHGGVGVDGVADEVRQRLPGELVDHVEQLEHPPLAVTSNW